VTKKSSGPDLQDGHLIVQRRNARTRQHLHVALRSCRRLSINAAKLAVWKVQTDSGEAPVAGALPALPDSRISSEVEQHAARCQLDLACQSQRAARAGFRA